MPGIEWSVGLGGWLELGGPAPPHALRLQRVDPPSQMREASRAGDPAESENQGWQTLLGNRPLRDMAALVRRRARQALGKSARLSGNLARGVNLDPNGD